MIAPPAAPATLPWLLAGPPPTSGPEPLAGHLDRLGPASAGGPDVLDAVARGGLQGRGGARFPTAVKWEAVAARGRGRAVVLVNGAEGEPGSWKDQVLMSARPHLVLDGAVLAAQTVGAPEVVLYVGRAFPHARRALEAALGEREHARRPAGGRPRQPRVRIVSAPPRYVAGEETAAVSLVNGREAKPTVVPPRPFERGVDGRPTLVQNVETLALVALLARFGPAWLRSTGPPACPGPMLVTVRGAVSAPGVYEVPHGTPLREVVGLAGGRLEAAPALLVGGYFGAWLPGPAAAWLTLDDRSLAQAGARPGCGALAVLPEQACGVAETARILAFLAHESARQCGPCREGLPALARLLQQVAEGRVTPADAERLQRWVGQLGGGRGACRHPDGAIGLLQSALAVFASDFDGHLRQRPCSYAQHAAGLPFPPPSEDWR